jgi:hypothetical protein
MHTRTPVTTSTLTPRILLWTPRRLTESPTQAAKTKLFESSFGSGFALPKVARIGRRMPFGILKRLWSLCKTLPFRGV